MDLQKVQRRAIKMIKGMEWLFSEERLKRPELFNVERQRLRSVMITGTNGTNSLRWWIR